MTTIPPVVQFVLDTDGIAGAYIDDPVAASRHAKKVNGVVVSLPVAEDHREDHMTGR